MFRSTVSAAVSLQLYGCDTFRLCGLGTLLGVEVELGGGESGGVEVSAEGWVGGFCGR